MDQKAICRQCKYVDKRGIRSDFEFFNIWRCKKYPIKQYINYQTGEETNIYEKCLNKNPDGSCLDFSKKESIWKRILGRMRKLLTRKQKDLK